MDKKVIDNRRELLGSIDVQDELSQLQLTIKLLEQEVRELVAERIVLMRVIEDYQKTFFRLTEQIKRKDTINALFR
jgi:hypothetical protein